MRNFKVSATDIAWMTKIELNFLQRTSRHDAHPHHDAHTTIDEGLHTDTSHICTPTSCITHRPCSLSNSAIGNCSPTNTRQLAEDTLSPHSVFSTHQCQPTLSDEERDTTVDLTIRDTETFTTTNASPAHTDADAHAHDHDHEVDDPFILLSGMGREQASSITHPDRPMHICQLHDPDEDCDINSSCEPTTDEDEGLCESNDPMTLFIFTMWTGNK